MIDRDTVEDLWDDMDRLNALYEELLWSHKDKLEFTPDYKNNRIIINNVSMNGNQSKSKST
tara:strand:- start:114 stop:296 length:183 start_codon:yes stop_codon:yes gene_type:complete